MSDATRSRMTQVASAAVAEPLLRVVIYDERCLFREALAALLNAVEGFTAQTATVPAPERPSLVRKLPADLADVIIIGVAGSAAWAARCAVEVRARVPEATVVLLSDDPSPGLVSLVLEHHLNGLLVTDSPTTDFVASLRQIVAGHALLPAGWQEIAAGVDNSPISSLTGRQREVLLLLAEGLNYDDIGARLFISANTVKYHARSIFARLGVRNRIAAVRLLASADTAGRTSKPPIPATELDQH